MYDDDNHCQRPAISLIQRMGGVMKEIYFFLSNAVEGVLSRWMSFVTHFQNCPLISRRNCRKLVLIFESKSKHQFCCFNQGLQCVNNHWSQQSRGNGFLKTPKVKYQKPLLFPLHEIAAKKRKNIKPVPNSSSSFEYIVCSIYYISQLIVFFVFICFLKIILPMIAQSYVLSIV